jgi:hypothetical protein
MPTESGFSNQKMLGRSRHKTLGPMGSDRIGEPTAQMYLSALTPIAITILNAVKSVDGKTVAIEVDGDHYSRRGDMLRFIDGNLIGWEIEIVSVEDPYNFTILNIGDNGALTGDAEQLPSIGELVKCLRWVTATASSEGGLVTEPGPLQFTRNATTVIVNEDTTDPTNNIGLPVKTLSPFFKNYSLVDMAIDNVTDAAYVELNSDIGADTISKIQVFMQNGNPLILAYGAAAAEVDQGILTPGGNGIMDVTIPPNTRLSVKSAIAGVTSDAGLLIVNFLG